jgi:glutamate-5-semialdehyde dehydrogenase
MQYCRDAVGESEYRRALPALSQQMAERGVTLHADEMALAMLQAGPANVVAVKANNMTMSFRRWI